MRTVPSQKRPLGERLRQLKGFGHCEEPRRGDPSAVIASAPERSEGERSNLTASGRAPQLQGPEIASPRNNRDRGARNDKFKHPLLEETVFGEWIISNSKRVFCVAEKFLLSSQHGSLPLRSWLQPTYEGLSVICKESKARNLDPCKTVFLDTETTGLAGGTGTLAFLVGCAFLEGDAFKIEQFFIDDFEHESLMLRKVVHRLKRAKFLVTFNGKAYDREILESRFTLHKLPSPLEHLIHLDLLHASRRLWKEVVPDCALKTLEKSILGFERMSDIPGEEIPTAYFDYLTRRDPARLPEIFKHNRLDLLSLVALASKMNLLYLSRVARPEERVSIGQIFYSLGERKRALDWLTSSGTCHPEPARSNTPAVSLRKIYSICLKSEGRSEEAISIWQDWIRTMRFFDPFPYEELAKYYEHKARDPQEALEVTEEALKKCRNSFSWLPNRTIGQSNGAVPSVVSRILRRRTRLLRISRNTAHLGKSGKRGQTPLQVS